MNRPKWGDAFVQSVSAWGPGLLVMLADTDVGNIVTAAQSGAGWGYQLLPLILGLIPFLYLVQELTVRLAIYTGKGYVELLRLHWGRSWAWVSVAGLTIATLGSLVTEFTGVAGVGEMFGISRSWTLPVAFAALVSIVLSGRYRSIEMLALAIGFFELAFIAVAVGAHPDMQVVVAEISATPWTDRNLLYLSAALIGSAFNPWMIAYQQSATAEKRTGAEHLSAARWDTAVGAILTQVLTASVLIAVAATLGHSASIRSIRSIGEISDALSPLLGPATARLVFSCGVLGASLLAAIVSSLALAWGIAEALGSRRQHTAGPYLTAGTGILFSVGVGVSAAVVWASPDMVSLNVTTQVLNTFILPLMIGALIALAVKSLPAEVALSRGYLYLFSGSAFLVCGAGIFGGLAGAY